MLKCVDYAAMSRQIFDTADTGLKNLASGKALNV